METDNHSVNMPITVIYIGVYVSKLADFFLRREILYWQITVT